MVYGERWMVNGGCCLVNSAVDGGKCGGQCSGCCMTDGGWKWDEGWVWVCQRVGGFVGGGKGYVLTPMLAWG